MMHLTAYRATFITPSRSCGGCGTAAIQKKRSANFGCINTTLISQNVFFFCYAQNSFLTGDRVIRYINSFFAPEWFHCKFLHSYHGVPNIVRLSQLIVKYKSFPHSQMLNIEINIPSMNKQALVDSLNRSANIVIAVCFQLDTLNLRKIIVKLPAVNRLIDLRMGGK